MLESGIIGCDNDTNVPKATTYGNNWNYSAFLVKFCGHFSYTLSHQIVYLAFKKES